MSKFKGTPGPWRVARQNPSATTGEWMIAGEKSGYLAEARDCGTGEVEANAKLIASSPDLLEALELVISTYEEGGWPSATMTVVRAAVSKAKGVTA